MSTRMPLILLALFLVLDFRMVSAGMSCLVMRPGYGLVSEECPSHSVGCRIRAKKDLIEWYELSRLYDRNQLVCVYPEEYKSLTGCMRKPSGSVRCWCGGRENCNDPETSRDLYEAFMEGDNDIVDKISEWLKTAKNESTSWKKLETTTISTSSTTTTTTTPTTVRPTPKKLVKTTKKSPTTTQPTTTTSKKPQKRIGVTKKGTETNSEENNKFRVINIVDIRDKGVPLSTDNNDISLDDTFEETRKKFEKEMEEEDARLKEMLADEEEEDDAFNENSEDIETNEITAEDQREMERETYRMERRKAEEKRHEEDDILRKIEEDEIRASADTERSVIRPSINDDYSNFAYNFSCSKFSLFSIFICSILFAFKF